MILNCDGATDDQGRFIRIPEKCLGTGKMCSWRVGRDQCGGCPKTGLTVVQERKDG